MPVTVTAAASTKNLARLTTAKEYLGITGTNDDAFIKKLITRVSIAIEQFTGRVFATETVTEKLAGFANTQMALSRRPIRAVSEVRFDGEVVANTEYELFDANAGLMFRTTGWHSTLQFKSGVVPSLSPGNERYLWEFDYIGGFDLPDFAAPTDPLLPADIEMAALETIQSIFNKKGRDPNIKSKSIGRFWSVKYAMRSIPMTAIETLNKHTEVVFA